MTDLLFETQLQVWGYALYGDSDTSAIVAENPEFDTDFLGRPLWDCQDSYLKTVEYYLGEEKIEPPLHWCLPYVTELLVLRLGRRESS